MRDSHLDFLDIVHDRRHQPAGGVRFEELRALPDDFVEDRVAQVGDRRASHVIHQVIRQVIADSLGEEYGQYGEGHHGPDAAVVHRAGHDLAEIDRVVEDRVLEQQYWRVDGSRIEHAVEDRDRSAARSCRARRLRKPSGAPIAAGRPNSVWRKPAGATGLSCVHPHAFQGVEHLLFGDRSDARRALNNDRWGAPGMPDGRVGASRRSRPPEDRRPRPYGPVRNRCRGIARRRTAEI